MELDPHNRSSWPSVNAKNAETGSPPSKYDVAFGHALNIRIILSN